MQHSENNEPDKDKIFTTLCHAIAHITINSYAIENALFGHIKANEQIPFSKYFDDLGFRSFAKYLDIKQLDGHAIENSYLKELTDDEICFELYSEQIDYIFYNAPKFDDDIGNDDETDIFHYKYGLYEYLKDLYRLFREITAIDISPEILYTTPHMLDKTSRKAYYTKISNFISDIKIKNLRKGSCVNRYVKDLPFISSFVQRLLKKHNKRFILVNNDTDSIDYKLALLSCFHLHNENNSKLLEQKILQWENLNR